MFTGLIDTICSVKTVQQKTNGLLITVDLGKLAGEVKTGHSVAVNGVCLTVTQLQGSCANFDVSSETLKRTTLGKLKPSQHVNIELALKADGRFGGHFVQGHVDGTATIKAINKLGRFSDFKFETQPELLCQMVPKGSVAVDGISLTVTEMNKYGFSVAIIPETLRKTTLGNAKTGDLVNIETDLIVKTIRKHLDEILPRQGLTTEKLKELGF